MHPQDFRYRAMIGVGGIGTGKFFALNGNHTLGREESRMGRFLDQRDYCKLHIISHYVQTLTGSDFHTFPVGRVGDDEWGIALFEEMKSAGLEMQYVEIAPGEQTLYSICFVYPDGSGGNLTVDDSACGRMDVDYVKRVEPEFSTYEGQGIALAVPEVSLKARQTLLEMATQHSFFRVASLNSEEARSRDSDKLLVLTNLLAANLEEASTLTGQAVDIHRLPATIEAILSELTRKYPDLYVAITAGKHGSWVWDGSALVHALALPVWVVNNAGAGDAFLSGMVAGISANLTMAQAQELGNLAAGMSVTSSHTIHKGINCQSLIGFADRLSVTVSKDVMDFLKEKG